MKLKIVALVACCTLASKYSKAQSGCTDINASNYNASATTNDGSCIYPLSYTSPSFKYDLSTALRESSGIIYTDHQLWTENDGGNPNAFFRIDSLTGAVLQVVFVDNFPNVDWEDISADKDYIYLSETGNNDGTRKDLKILKIAKSDISGADTVHLNAEAINISYADQTSFVSSSTHNFDCEALIAKGDSLFLFSKDRGDYRTKVYGVPKIPGTYVLDTIVSFNVSGLVCGADYNEATDEIMLIGYTGAKSSFIWHLNEFTGKNFFSGNKRKINLNSTKAWQTEAVTFINDQHLLISTESVGSSPAAIYNLDKNWDKSTSIAEQLASAAAYQLYPNPTKGILYIQSENRLKQYTVMTLSGQKELSGTPSLSKDIQIETQGLATGLHLILLEDEMGHSFMSQFTKK